jgi:hypothetical protein
MKTYKIALMLGAMAITPGLAVAGSSHVDAGYVGEAQALFDFCSNVDRAEDLNYDRQAKQLVAGLSKDAIDDLRESSAYRQGYQSLRVVLSGLSASDSLLYCRALVVNRQETRR